MLTCIKAESIDSAYFLSNDCRLKSSISRPNPLISTSGRRRHPSRNFSMNIPSIVSTPTTLFRNPEQKISNTI